MLAADAAGDVKAIGLALRLGRRPFAARSEIPAADPDSLLLARWLRGLDIDKVRAGPVRVDDRRNAGASSNSEHR
jgi:hypothetical protein